MGADCVETRSTRIPGDSSTEVQVLIVESRPTRGSGASWMVRHHLVGQGEAIASGRASPHTGYRILPDYRPSSDRARIVRLFHWLRYRSADSVSFGISLLSKWIGSRDRTDTAVCERRRQGMPDTLAGNGQEQLWGQNGPEHVEWPGVTRNHGVTARQRGMVGRPRIHWSFVSLAQPGEIPSPAYPARWFDSLLCRCRFKPLSPFDPRGPWAGHLTDPGFVSKGHVRPIRKGHEP